MKIEVEQKFRLEHPGQIEQIEQILGKRQIAISAPELQVDTYFAHPARDFARTDEALRVRRIGQQNFVTYKGPKLDAVTKTRREIELPIAPSEEGAAQFGELLSALGFRRVAEVRKNRRHATLPVEAGLIEAAFDDVAEVGSFVELEAVVDEPQVPWAKQQLAQWAAALGLAVNERRSYLELLLEARDATSKMK
jgi:adenylate cyclase class 2